MGFHQKLIEMVKATYDGNQCSVRDDTGLTGWFDVKSGVKQGCNISGFLFLFLIDWIMESTVEGSNAAIRWIMRSKLDNLHFPEDISLTSGPKTQIQQKLLSFSTTLKHWAEDLCEDKTSQIERDQQREGAS